MNKQKEWDLYFLRIAREVSKKSKCLSRKIGAVLTRDNAIVSTGYNGPTRGVKHCNERDYFFYEKLINPQSERSGLKNLEISNECPRRMFGYKSGQGLQLCQAGHAERNALIQAARNSTSTKDTTLYCFCGQVCKDCAIEMINAGVKELIYLQGPPYDQYADVILNESGIVVRRIDEKDL